MTEDVKLATGWLVGALLLSIIINSIAVITRAHSEPGDPRDYAAAGQAFAQPTTYRRHWRRHAARRAARHRDEGPSLASLVHRQAEMIEQMRRELAEIRREFRVGDAVRIEPPAPAQQNSVAVAALIDLPKEASPPKDAGPVMPATATQRGQWNDRRRRHRHAGIDLGGEYGSPIVASYAGRVLSPPGGDRGYGPHCMVIQGDDGIVYRYAHMASVNVKIGERVKTGQQIGTMGKVGRRGFVHLHFEMMRVAEYRKRPYGVHKLDPNDYLGGGRGRRMVAGAAMTGQSAVATAKLSP